jgi:succinyl-CoA synthetase, beta subunit
MNLHEFQANQLITEYGVPVAPFRVVRSVREAVDAARELGGKRCMVKAQVHAGGRGKGGGVKLVETRDTAALEAVAGALLGSRLVTPQTGKDGLPINVLLIQSAINISRELYLGVLVDRKRSRIVFMASSAGGMGIEEVAAKAPERIMSVAVDPAAGLQPYQCRRVAFVLGLKGKQVGLLIKIMIGLYRLFVDKDLSLIEINPLIVTERGELLALDAKINVDDNALYRNPMLENWRDITQEDPTEHAAAQHGLNYIALGGNIACMVNGAGLAMATMDLIKLHGGEPANFLDVGGNTTAEKVAEAFKLILSDAKVKAILVNIFGGIVRCDLIAEGIIKAMQEASINVPVVVRLEGTNVERGYELLRKSGLDLKTATNLREAAEKVVAACAR